MSLTPDEMSDIVIFYAAAVNKHAFGKNKPIKIKSIKEIYK